MISPPLLITNQSELRFWHTIDSEQSGFYPDSAYDGGNVWISVDGGAYSILTPNGDYPKDFRYLSGSGNPSSGPQPGNPCYAGTVSTWAENVFDLSAYAGASVQFRFRFSSDVSGNREGWYVDDISLLGEPIAVEPPQPVDGLVIQSDGVNTYLNWPPSTTIDAQYNIYMSTTQDLEPINATLVAQTPDTFYVHEGIVDINEYVIYQVTVSVP